MRYSRRSLRNRPINVSRLSKHYDRKKNLSLKRLKPSMKFMDRLINSMKVKPIVMLSYHPCKRKMNGSRLTIVILKLELAVCLRTEIWPWPKAKNSYLNWIFLNHNFLPSRVLKSSRHSKRRWSTRWMSSLKRRRISSSSRSVSFKSNKGTCWLFTIRWRRS